MTQCLELSYIAAELSHKLAELHAPLLKVTKVLNSRTFEVVPTNAHIPPSKFWQDDLDHKILSPEQKDRMYLQVHRSGTESMNLAFVIALQELCDSGVALYHEGQPVVDIWVMHTNEFDVSDIIGTRVPVIVDPISGFALSTLPTHENMDTLRRQGRLVCARLGFEVPEGNTAGDQYRMHRPDSYKRTAPHTWVAAIIEASMHGAEKERRMVHIDIYGAAYSDAGFRMHNGSLVSLHIFTTPQYSLMPRRRMRKTVGHALVTNDKFVMEPSTQPIPGSLRKPMLSLQPYSVRHLRCFHRMDDSVISVSALSMYTARQTRYMSLVSPKWYSFIAELRHNIVLRLPAGFGVLVCNLQNRSELNGRKGRVHNVVSFDPPTERIPVVVTGVNNPLSLKTTSVRLTERKQYLSHDELHQKVEEVQEAPWEKDELPPMSDRQIEAFEDAVKRDPDMMHAYQVLSSRKYTMSCYTDPVFNRGVRKILVPSFDLIMAPAMARAVRNGMYVADHPKSKQVYSILQVMKTAKQKVLEQNPSLARSDGTVTVVRGSDHRRLLDMIIEKIKADPDLTDLFNFMDDNGLFPNPVRHLR